MPRLPRVIGTVTVRALEKAGYEVFDQSASHVFLHRWHGSGWSERVTVPVHAGKILRRLAENPRPRGCVKLQSGVDEYRIRVSNHRVL